MKPSICRAIWNLLSTEVVRDNNHAAASVNNPVSNSRQCNNGLRLTWLQMSAIMQEKQ